MPMPMPEHHLRKLDAVTQNKIARLYLSGRTTKEICDKLNLNWFDVLLAGIQSGAVNEKDLQGE